jgi:hypothetical protein|tara:strand:- start:1834 stop:2337 length:504 start_codon:yes stop_codon:yes gene_type:complete
MSPLLQSIYSRLSSEEQGKIQQIKQQNPNKSDEEIILGFLDEKKKLRRRNEMRGDMKPVTTRVVTKWQEVLKTKKRHPALKRAGVSGFSKPKRTPKHPKKSHVVVVKDGKKTKTIRFGEQGASVAGKPKKGESKRMKAKRKSFKSRHRKNIKRGKTSAAYWANKVKW